jgi:hypothetical protein
LDHRRLKHQELEPNQNDESAPAFLFNNIRKIINNINLLPHGVFFENVNLNGDLIFKDGNGTLVNIKDLSDGFRSILSMTLELIRQLILTYSVETVFPKNTEMDSMIQIKLPGVVLIDEIDVHLHPTWQTKIGKWFTHVFPNIQFIVATHSPFVCRACQNGSIWRLATPNTKMLAGVIQGIERDRLIYGNILDAYGTDLFGGAVSIDEDTAKLRNRLGTLYEKSILGLIEPEEEAEFISLKYLFPLYRIKNKTLK